MITFLWSTEWYLSPFSYHLRPNCAISKSRHDRKLWCLHCFSWKIFKEMMTLILQSHLFWGSWFYKSGRSSDSANNLYAERIISLLIVRDNQIWQSVRGFSGALGGFAGGYISVCHIFIRFMIILMKKCVKKSWKFGLSLQIVYLVSKDVENDRKMRQFPIFNLFNTYTLHITHTVFG